MKIQKEQIEDFNKKEIENHNDNFNFLANQITKKGNNISDIVSKLEDLNLEEDFLMSFLKICCFFLTRSLVLIRKQTLCSGE